MEGGGIYCSARAVNDGNEIDLNHCAPAIGIGGGQMRQPARLDQTHM